VSDNHSEASADYILLTRLADEFAQRYRHGERPSLSEYVARYPHLATDIRELFPALVEVEQVKEDHQEAAGQEAAPPAPALQQLGDFRILREVGKGGMGVVYEAEQVSLGRHVALKVLPRNLLLDAKAKRRFEREAKSAAKLHHTNIVPVFGVGEQDGLPYYVMQFIQGLGLDEVLEELTRLQPGNAGIGTHAAGELRVSQRELSAVHVARSLLTGEFLGTKDRNVEDAAAVSPDAAPREDPGANSSRPPALSDSFALSSSAVVLPGGSRDGSKSRHRKQTYWQSVARIGAQVAEALEYAHKQGIKHRDIKPSNLLLDTQGTVWVTDFGLAKADDQQNLTHTGDILGTLRYMPPEAFEGRSDARSDVYSLGLTLYEMLAFRPAFEEKERNRLIKQVTQEEPDRLGKLNRHVPQDLETIVHKAIDRDPNQRYASAGAMAEDLQRFIEDEPIKARRVSHTERLWRWCRRNPAVASLTALVALLLVSSAVGAVFWAVSADSSAKRERAAAERERDAAKQADLAAEFAKQQAGRATREAGRSRRQLYASDMSMAYQAWEAGDTGRAGELLRSQWPQTGKEDLRGFEWRHLWQLCRDSSRQTLRGHASNVNSVAFSLDGKTLVTASFQEREGDRSVCIWDLDSRRHAKLLVPQLTQAAITPDGKIVAISELVSQTVRLWDVAANHERGMLPHPTWVSSVAVSPRGDFLATGGFDGIVRLWDLATRQELVPPLKAHVGGVSKVRFSPDGRTLASGGVDSTVRLWDVAGRRPPTTLQGHTFLVSSLSFSPDGKTLASASLDCTVRLWDTASGQTLKTLGVPKMAIGTAAFSPDGKILATGGGDGAVRAWDVETKEVLALLRGHTAEVTAVEFAPDGRSLVSGSRDGTVKVWDMAAVQDPNILTRQKGIVSWVAFSPDGKTLAVTDTYDKTVSFWDPFSRRQDAILKGHQQLVVAGMFARDGRTLATTSFDNTVRVWDVAKKKEVAKFQSGSRFMAPALSPDGKFLAAVAPWRSGGLVWDTATKRQVAHLEPASGVQFSPDGALLAAGSGNTVWLWDVATWHKVAPLMEPTADVGPLDFAPDGRTLATGDTDGTLRLWDLAHKKQLASRRGHASHINSVAFSPDGKRLATASPDGTIELWDVGLFHEVATLTGHAGSVTCVAFSCDGNTLASASADGTVRLWHAPPELAALREPADSPSVTPSETIRPMSLLVQGAAQATLNIEGKAYRVDVTAVDDTDYHVQLWRGLDNLQEGATYTVRFRAKANVTRQIWHGGQVVGGDWHSIGLGQAVELTDQWKNCEAQFQAKGLAAQNQIAFNLGQQTGTVWIDDFTVTKDAK
jgi:WD40 repeat protein/serine/threonine protein kinase